MNIIGILSSLQAIVIISALIIIVYLIIKRVKAKRNEDFEKRDH